MASLNVCLEGSWWGCGTAAVLPASHMDASLCPSCCTSLLLPARERHKMAPPRDLGRPSERRPSWLNTAHCSHLGEMNDRQNISPLPPHNYTNKSWKRIKLRAQHSGVPDYSSAHSIIPYGPWIVFRLLHLCISCSSTKKKKSAFQIKKNKFLM